jgi:HYR domain-containing protein
VNSHWQPNMVAAVDLNCDGAMDLISANMNVSFVSVMLTPGGTDTTAPTVTAPPNVSVSTGALCNAVVSDGQLGTATAHDNCGCAVVVRTGVPAGNIFPVGVTTVTYTATDAHGNSASATQTVTVTDGTPPAITAPSNITVTADNTCTATVSLGTPVTSDNCGSVSTTATRSDAQPLAAPFAIGTTTVTYLATDTHGNTATATQTVTVNVPPVSIDGASANPSVIWPPNHKMIDVTINYTTSGGCGSVNCSITSITSNEPINSTGDGNTPADVQIVDAHHVRLRAERSGTGGTGRTYSITITCTDGGGHTATTVVVVTVPYSQ